MDIYVCVLRHVDTTFTTESMRHSSDSSVIRNISNNHVVHPQSRSALTLNSQTKRQQSSLLTAK